MLRRFSRATAYTCVAVAAIAICVRVTAQDTWPTSAWIFYSVPPPVLPLLLLAATMFLAVTAAGIAAMACLVAATLVYAPWHFRQEFHRPCAAVDDGVRVLAWNVARGRAGWDAIAEYAAQSDADQRFVEAAVLALGFAHIHRIEQRGIINHAHRHSKQKLRQDHNRQVLHQQ